MLCDDGDFVRLQLVLFAWHNSALQSLSVILAWPADGGLAAAKAVAVKRSITARQIHGIERPALFLLFMEVLLEIVNRIGKVRQSALLAASPATRCLYVIGS
jgi:hypothetical protein